MKWGPPGGDFRTPSPAPDFKRDGVKPGVAFDPDAACKALGGRLLEGPRPAPSLSWTLSLGGTMMCGNLDVGALMDVVVWLRGLGLERYEAAFRDNEIDETVLPNLTAEDLKDLGVGIVGHRRKLLDAIAALRTDAGAKAPSADVSDRVRYPKRPCRRPRRAPSGDGDVLGLGGLYGALGPYGP